MPPAVLDNRYDYIVSLGGNCAPAMAIRNYFSVGRAFPFDWWITSFESLELALNNGFSRMFDAPDLRVLQSEGTTVVSTRYWIKYQHDFARDADGRVKPDIESQAASVAEKYTRRFTRTATLLRGSRVLFVRTGIAEGQPEDTPRTIRRATRLADALQRVWHPAEMNLLAIVSQEEAARLPGQIDTVLFDMLGPPTGEMWRAEQFNALFKRQKITLAEQPAQSPTEAV